MRWHGAGLDTPPGLPDDGLWLMERLMHVFWFLLACQTFQPPEPPAGDAAPSRADNPPFVAERWEPVDGGPLCLIFDDSGALTMAIIGGASPGKVEITADYERTDTALHVVPRRILRHRYVSRCREHVESEKYLDAEDVLGLRLVPGEEATFTLRALSASRLEVCGLPARCVRLGRVEP